MPYFTEIGVCYIGPSTNKEKNYPFNLQIHTHKQTHTHTSVYSLSL